MKNVFKKACVLGSAALLAMGMSSSMVGARTPTATDLGIRAEQVPIDKGLLDWLPSFTFASGLKYTGNPQQLITGLTNDVPTDATLYVRVANSLGALPVSDSDWVPYTNSDSFSNDNLMRTGVGTYHIYWYLDGGANHDDIATVPETQP